MNPEKIDAAVLHQKLRQVVGRIPADFGGGSPLSKTFLMAYLLLEFKLKTYVEIGVYRGRSFFPLAYAAALQGGMAFGIDAYDYETALEQDLDEEMRRQVSDFLATLDFAKIYEHVQDLRKQLDLEQHCRIIRDKSLNAVHLFQQEHVSIDMLHIDGNHDTQQVQAEVDAFLPLMSPGGFIVMDDVDWGSVNKVFEDLRKDHEVVFHDGHFAVLLIPSAREQLSQLEKDLLEGLHSLAAVLEEASQPAQASPAEPAQEEQQEAKDLRVELFRTNVRLRNVKRDLERSELQNIGLEKQIQVLSSSASSKAAGHPRAGIKAAGRVRMWVRTYLYRVAAWIYHALPVSRENRLRLKDIIQRRYGLTLRDPHDVWVESAALSAAQADEVSSPFSAVRAPQPPGGTEESPEPAWLAGKVTGRPVVSVIVTSYNHEKYIQQCLDAILMQAGTFNMEVILGDDFSTDKTAEIMREYVEAFPLIFRLLPTPANLGVTRNLKRCLDACRGDYIAICEGDDYWTDNFKLQKQMTFLDENQDYSMCFSAINLLFEEENRMVPFIDQVNLHKSTVTTEDLIERNFIGNFSCCMYRTAAVRRLPPEIFQVFTVDWMFNMSCAQIGKIGFIKEWMSVYRKHSRGVWTGKSDLQQINEMIPLVDAYNRLLGYRYATHFEAYQGRLHGVKSALEAQQKSSLGQNQKSYDYVDVKDDPDKQAELLILDTLFPHPLSPFRLQEFVSYLDTFPFARVLTSGEHLYAIKEARPIDELIAAFESENPHYRGRVHSIPLQPASLSGRLAYATFLNNIYRFLPALERAKIPFVFTLYPGGGFALNTRESDAKLARVLSSPQFRKVIVTQKITYEYLVQKAFCLPGQIEFIYGVVTPLDLLKDYPEKKHFGFDKSTLDICFVAYRYMEKGKDKGYDVFIEVAQRLAGSHPEIRFHVVGGFSPAEISIDGLDDKIFFYGPRAGKWFDDFYRDKDIILSPNVPFMLRKGTFDGFPTASCTEAGVRKVAMFCTDELQLNSAFADGQDLVIIPHDAGKIAAVMEQYCADPGRLRSIALNGALKIRNVYSYESQILPRIRILEQELEMTLASRQPGTREKLDATPN